MTQQIQKAGTQAPAKQSLQALFESRKDEIAKLIPSHLTVDRILKVALTTILKNPILAQCDQKSLLSSVMALSEVGLEPGGALGHAYLVPRKNKGAWQCMPIISFRGYIELARRSGQLEQVEAHIVYDGDEFEVAYGMNPKLHHVPDWNLDRAKAKRILAYSVARFRGGGVHVELMPMREIEAIRGRSPAKDSGPWVTDFDEMAKKTVVRRASKYWPLSSELANALAMEDEHETVEGQVATRKEGPKVRAISSAVDAAGLFADVEEGDVVDHDPTTGEVNEPAAAEMSPVDQIIALAAEAQDLKATDALVTKLKALGDVQGKDDALKAIMDRQAQLRGGKTN